jgi:hypothetical protein
MDPEIAKAIHSLNAQSHDLNQHIVQRSATMQEVPMDQTVYQEAEKARQRIAERQNPQQVVQQVQQPVQSQPIPQPVQQIVQQDLTPLIDRITAVEKQVTKFVNLIERNVAKNAKEINIRIKLNENNDSTDSK